MLFKKLLRLYLLFLTICSSSIVVVAQEQSFTVAMIPDTQQYIDYRLQTSEGFAINSADLFIAQMQYIAGKSRSNGGDIEFVASVGDVWQHVFSDTDPAHFARGVGPELESPVTNMFVNPEMTGGFEIPKAIEGYRIIEQADISFGVAPGNHDYDAWWAMENPDIGGDSDSPVMFHVGGLTNFKRVFGSDSEFFQDKDWYISGYNGGSSSAQLFSSGGYRFLHLALEMQAGDAVLGWAQSVLDQYPGVPAIISTHDYLSPRGERIPSGTMDLALLDPSHNNYAEAIWENFISKNDQVFLLLCGHQPGQSLRIDNNDVGNEVIQMLADYQIRGQAALDAGQQPDANGSVPGVGDGWYRELTFHLGGENPRLQVRTYSTHYDVYSEDLESYADWYREREQPQMTDEEFFQAEEFTIPLGDFYQRFGMPAQ